MKYTIKFITFIIIIYQLFAASFLLADTFVVAQTAAGDGSGDDYDNRAAIATINAGTGNFADMSSDRVYFCGAFSSSFIPRTGGSGVGTEATWDGDCSVIGGSDAYFDFEGDTSSTVINLDTYNPSYIVITGMHIHGGYYGIKASDNDYLTITKNTIHEQPKSAVFVGGSHIVVGGSAANGNVLYDGTGGTGGGTVAIPGGGSYIEVSYNLIYNGVDGVVCDNGPDHIYVRYNKIYTMSENLVDFKGVEDGEMIGNDGSDSRSQGLVCQPCQRVTILGNYIHETGHRNYTTSSARAAITLHDADEANNICIDNIIAYNLIVNNWGDGIEIWEDKGYEISGNLIYGNTVFQNGRKTNDSDDYFGIRLGSGIDGGHEVVNNIVGDSDINSDDTQIVIDDASSVDVVDYNRVYYSSGTAQIYYNGADRTVAWMIENTPWDYNTEGDPEFTDPDNGDWTLDTDSECIGTGDNLGATYEEGLGEVLTSNWTLTFEQVAQGDDWNQGCYVEVEDAGVNIMPPTLKEIYEMMGI